MNYWWPSIPVGNLINRVNAYLWSQSSIHQQNMILCIHASENQEQISLFLSFWIEKKEEYSQDQDSSLA